MVLTAWTQTGVASLLSFFLFFSSCKCMLRVRSVFALGFDITSTVLPHPVLLIKPMTLNVERLTWSHWTGFCYLEAKGSFKEPFGWEASRRLFAALLSNMGGSKLPCRLNGRCLSSCLMHDIVYVCRPSAPRRWGSLVNMARVTARRWGRWWRKLKSPSTPNTPALSVAR